MDDDMIEDEESVFKILLATDIHLGFKERNTERGDDSFVAFEEILEYAHSEKVDFILLGGDLFHENKPSRRSLQRCVDLLRKYCLGPAQSNFEFLSDPSVNFKNCATPQVNFEDPNLRVSIPIFSIHGNHDDPCGEGNYSVMDMLATTGFVNYFGKLQNLDHLTFQPILLRKGETLVSLFGVGSMNDDRLFRLFEEEKVHFEVAAEFEDDWFHMLVLHQNRARHGSKSYTGEHLLPDFLDLVFWGHEHECRIEPEDYQDKFRVIQPGSSVATSLCPAEAVPKHVGLLKVYKKEFTVEPLPLKTVRPLVFETMSLGTDFTGIGDQLAADDVVERVRAKIDEMLETAKELLTGHPKQPLLPLLRLRIEHEIDAPLGNARQLEMKMGLEGHVANADEVIKLIRKRAVQDKIEADIDEEAWDAVFTMDSINMVEGQLENLLVEYFQETTKAKPLVMHERTMAEAVRAYVEKSHDDAFADIIAIQAAQSATLLAGRPDVDREPIRQVFAEERRRRDVDPQLVVDEARSWLSGEVAATFKKEPAVKREPLMDNFSSEPLLDFVHKDAKEEPATPAARGRGGRGRAPRARAARAARGTGRGRAKAPVASDSDDAECSIVDEVSPRKVEKALCSRRGTCGRPSAPKNSIASAFARQVGTTPTVSTASQFTSTARRPPTAPASSSARGVCFVSDSDDD